ncbi:MAG: hypothetical protein ACE5GC_03775 [Acidimicrobiia bacterium]
MTIADRLTIGGIGVVLGLIGVFAYVAASPIFTSWVNVVVVQAIFATVYLVTVNLLHRHHDSAVATP